MQYELHIKRSKHYKVVLNIYGDMETMEDTMLGDQIIMLILLMDTNGYDIYATAPGVKIFQIYIKGTDIKIGLLSLSTELD